jgi:hypothetical protein
VKASAGRTGKTEGERDGGLSETGTIEWNQNQAIHVELRERGRWRIQH